MKLRTLISASAASIALLASTPALADGHAEQATELPSGPEGPALWQVSDEDTTIYLFGTIHAMPADVVWYDAEIDAALQSSDTVVTEIAMDPASQAQGQVLAQQVGLFTDGTTLRSLLTEEQTAAYEGGFAQLGLPAAAMAQFDMMEPWLVSLTFSVLPLLQPGYDLEAGVDQVIIGQAGDKQQEALETVEFQLGIFDGLPQDQQIEFLMAAVEGAGETAEMVDSMVAEWLEGDADGLATIMNEGFEGDDEAHQALASALLYDRNANWAEWIEERLDSTPGTVFIAVGAGHLAGEQSVQDYLAERDIETTRVQ